MATRSVSSVRQVIRPMGKSVVFSGTNSYIQIPNLNIASTGFFVAFWMKKAKTNSGEGWVWQADQDGKNGFGIASDGTTSHNFYALIGDSSNVNYLTSVNGGYGYVSRYKDWQHILFQFVSQGSPRMSFYINGIKRGENTGTPFFTGPNGTFTLGRKNSGTYAIGKMADFTFKNTPTLLTAQEREDLIYKGIKPSGSVYLDFNDNVVDKSGQGYNGQANNITYSSDVPILESRSTTTRKLYSTSFPMGVVFPGNQSGAGILAKITPTDTSVFDIGSSGKITLGCWVKLRRKRGDNHTILVSDYSFANNKGYLFQITDAGKMVVLSGNTTYTSTNSIVRHGENEHIMFRLNGTALDFFVNGEKKETLTIVRKDGNGSSSVNSIGQEGSSGNNRTISGLISNFFSVRESLTDEQMINIYNEVYPSVDILWPFQEGSGSTVYDLSGKNNNGSIGGTIWYESATYFSKRVPILTERIVKSPKYSIKSGSSGDKITLNSNLTIGKKYTYAAWLKPLSSGGGGTGRIFAGNNVQHFWSGTTSIQMQHNGSGGVAPPTGYFILNEWHHYIIAYDGCTGYFYRDGMLYDKKTYTAAVTTSSGSFYFLNTAAGDRWFDGYTYELKLINTKAVDKIEAQNMYLGWSHPEEIVVLNLQEGQSTVASDSSGKGRHGTISGCSWSTDVPNV